MKTHAYYKIGIIVMGIMIVYELLFSVIFIIPDESETREFRQALLYPISAITVTTLTGLVLYINKKTLGWTLCCGLFFFMFAGTIIGYFIFRQLGNSLEADMSDLTVPAIIQSVLFACAALLFLTRQVRSVFFNSEQNKLQDVLPTVAVTTILVGILVFAPILAKFVKAYYVVILAGIMLLILRWLINRSVNR